MTQPPAAPAARSRTARSQIAANPVISAIIAVLLFACVFFSLYVPLYASVTPKIGDFPFFYFYLLVYMPVVAVVLGIVLFLQSRMRPVAADGGEPGEVAQ